MNRGNLVILDNLRSAHNTGSIFRTAAAFDFERIILTGVTPNSSNPGFLKASRNTEHMIESMQMNSIQDAIDYVRRSQYHIYSLEINGRSCPLDKAVIEMPLAVVLGNEANGVSDYAMAASEGILEISTGNKKHSLNVSTSFAIFAHHIFHKTVDIIKN